MAGIGHSGNDVGDNQLFERDDVVLEVQLFLFEPLNEHWVGLIGGENSVNGGVEIAVFLPDDGQTKLVLH